MLKNEGLLALHANPGQGFPGACRTLPLPILALVRGQTPGPRRIPDKLARRFLRTTRRQRSGTIG